MKSKFFIAVIVAVCLLSSWLTIFIYRLIHNALEESGTILYSELSWFFQLLLNLVGYGTIMIPGFIIYKYLEKTDYFLKLSNPTWVSRALSKCYAGGPRVEPPPKEPSPAKDSADLLFCFSGLMGAYLVWGLLQEKIMTQNYTMSDGSYTKFSDSQFLVLVNRLSALVVSAATLWWAGAAATAAPLYKFSYCSLTNIVSAWCQYEALKYVSFPTQVLSKSCKVLPVLAMSRLVSKTRHAAYEYVCAAVISAGMLLFLFGTDHRQTVSSVSWASGAVLLSLYLMCDSFTSTWQGQLFTQYHVSPVQMMFGVNMFSVLLTGVSLAQHPSTAASIALLQHPVFLTDVVLLSLSSALGQLLIYRTIARFGPVVFTIIMTLRQAVSILLSCVVYGHAVSWGGAAGGVLVFAGVLLRVYCRRRTRPPVKM